MLKPLSLIAATVLSVLSANAATETLFSANVKDFDADQFAEWTVEDLNDDGSTWTCSSQGSSGNVYYNYNSSNAGDDWLITPAITVAEAGSYILKYTTVGSSWGEKLEVWTGNAATSTAMSSKVAAYDLPSAETAFVEIVSLEAGELHIGFHAVTPADAYRLYLLNVELLKSDNPVDVRVKEIVAPVSGEGLAMEAVTVAIENCGGVDVSDIPVSYQLNEGETVSETAAITIKAGETANYTFNTKGDFSQGHFRHNITAWTSHPDDINSGNNACSAVVNHVAPANVPYATGFEDTEETDGMIFLNLNQDDGIWHVFTNDWWMGQFSRTGDKCLAYNYNADNNANDWAFIEPLALEEGYYAIKYWYSALSANHPEKLRVCWGYAPTPEAMTNEIIDYGKVTNEKYQQGIHIIKVDKPGSVYIGFYCYSDANENWLLIDDFSVEQIDPTKSDFSVTAISAPGQYITPAISRDVTFSIYNLGILDTDVDCVVYVDGSRLGSVGAMLRAQEEKSVTIEGLLSQLTPGTYELKVAVECSKDDDLSNNEMTTTITIVDQPVVLYDFEDGELHEDLTYRREDSYNNHADAGEEFNEDGFGIFALQHNLLGSHALAVNTWFDGSGTADRWVVMPQAEITGPDAHFVFNANSFNANFKESYRVMVSTGDDRWSQYSNVLAVDNEEIYVQTRGISLAEYEGKTIYVCIHVTTYNGEALILDNLAFYGNDVKPLNLGIEGVAVDNDADAPVEYYNLQGVRIDNPAKGNIYIVKQGQKASKIAF